jgi:LmbE family N-acetylglucosaminyl deacetylase
VVVAHPDDEALWLSSALAGADIVVFCYGDQFVAGKTSAARRRAVAGLKLPGLVNLALVESGVRKLVDWQNTRFTPAGVEIADAAAAARYAANFAALLDALRPVLAGCSEIYTHNPWGEYGHPEHVQVYRAVAALQAEFGFTIWFSGYFAPLTRRLARLAGWTARQERRPDVCAARRLFWNYWRFGAWTWPLSHRWPKREFYYAQAPGAMLRPMLGEVLTDVTRLRWWRRGAERVLD